MAETVFNNLTASNLLDVTGVVAVVTGGGFRSVGQSSSNLFYWFINVELTGDWAHVSLDIGCQWRYSLVTVRRLETSLVYTGQIKHNLIGTIAVSYFDSVLNSTEYQRSTAMLQRIPDSWAGCMASKGTEGDVSLKVRDDLHSVAADTLNANLGRSYATGRWNKKKEACYLPY